MRLRLTRTEVERLRSTGEVEESVDFGGGDVLVYRLQRRPEPGPVQARIQQGSITVSVSAQEAQIWTSSDEVGIYSQFGSLTISIEKDFRCLTRPEDESERDAFPHPGQRS